MQGADPRRRRAERHSVCQLSIWRVSTIEAEPHRPEGNRNATKNAKPHEINDGELAAHISEAE